MSTRATLALAFTALLLAACGTSTQDRALSGGAIGAGVGGAAGLLGGSPATGALLGGAVGAGAGALTNPNQIDLGKPVWK
jgi:osmotically inducible lipoprotein OsmB